MAPNDLVVRSGQIVALRLFDFANEIDLKRAEAIWVRRAQGGIARGRLIFTPAKAVSFGVPPLALDLGPVTLEIGGETRTAAASARLYDFGIATIALRLPVTDLHWAGFTALMNDTDRGVGPAADATVWTNLLATLREMLKDALDRPAPAQIQEDYLIARVDAFNEPVTADMLQERIDLVPLLSGEERPLSDAARNDLLRLRFSYYRDDLAVITWDRAFIHEPRRDNDVADVLEMANAQLLEMRTYDEMLDAELPRMRDLVGTARRRTALVVSHGYAKLARRLHTLVAEVSELTERVDNALQVTEDVYLARVYAAAMDLFRVPIVNAAVDRKLAIIRETYMALNAEAAAGRTELLEVAILVLILVEIVLSLVPH
jgi:hypothetical protein